jgi:phenylalanyl-tRNA synthetase beta chain
MRILHSWLQQYIKFKFTPTELAEKLGMLGLEVEGRESLGDRYAGFRIGHVLTVAKHPNADRLSVCTVDVKSEQLQVVCGAPNVAAGQKVVVGMVGATVPRNQHDPNGAPFTLARTKIRGVESFGMICSEYELDLGKDSSGILVLDQEAKTGNTLASHFGLDDVAYDVEITPNRPDWLSHFGVAREIGVLVKKKAALPDVKVRESRTSVKKHLTVSVVDKKNCLRFAARVVRGVTIGPSPLWLQNALRNVGLRPRNNIVDITNYVMLECGQPLHAFDYALLRGKRIVVRQTRSSAFQTLDGKEHQLPSDAVMVCDAEREISIAGIMGGANSEINDSTVDVVIESACWNPGSIRRTRRALGISTDASQRFERGTDPEGVWYALQRATGMIQQLAGGEVLKGSIDVRNVSARPRKIALRTDRTNSILGTSLSASAISGYLKLLNVTPAGRKGKVPLFSIPTYRVDLEREIDLIEEVARVHGYDNIEERSSASIDFTHVAPAFRFTDRVRQMLVGAGYHDALSYTLQDNATAELTGDEPVKLLGLETSETAAMRTSLLPGLAGAVARNISYGETNVRLFEIGRVYRIDNSPKPKFVDNYLEEERVCLVLTGSRSPIHWGGKPVPADWFDIKGEMEDLLSKFALDKSGFISYSTSNRLAEDAIAIEINGTYAGYYGNVKEGVLKRYKIEQPVYVAEVSLELLRNLETQRRYNPLPRYPKVRRDVAFIVDDSVTAEKLLTVIRTAGSALLQSVDLFDMYRGENLEAGKKSLAFTLELMSRERTLVDNEIESEVNRIVEAVIRETGAVLRAV